MKLFLKHATDKICVYRSVKIALVVGTILALINHYDSLFSGTLTAVNIFQILLTYLVPYVVATLGSAIHARYLELQDLQESEKSERRI
ncbi:MAG: nitrate/nitrite transporter NrtS [Candidatus Paceibacterota bacterium]